VDKSDIFKHLQIIEGVNQPSSVNKEIISKLKKRKKGVFTADDYVEGIKNGDRNLLAQAITLIESSLTEHETISRQIIEKCLPLSGNSIRIGITGVPGVGKSTFIESLGTYLTKAGNKLAVLAIDPSSNRSKGSILGDKTRMLNLSTDKNAFIRPSPSAGNIGGVARKTRETIILCEAAAYNIIFIETVGVGQSETAAYSMVDVFVLLMLAGAGDELQGIKRGIMELADLLVINKSDDVNQSHLNLAVSNYQNALHLMPSVIPGWQTPVEFCSSKTGHRIENIWKVITDFCTITKQQNYFEQKRQEQAKYWFYESLNLELKSLFYDNPAIKKQLMAYEKRIINNTINPFEASSILLEYYRKLNKKP